MRFEVIFLLMIGMVGCYSSGDSGTYDDTEITDNAREMFDNYFTDIGREGLTAEFKYLDSSDEFFWVPPGYSSALTYDSVRTILEGNAGNFQSVVFAWEDLFMQALSPKLVNYTGIINSKMIDTSGVEIQSRMIETGIVIQRADGWKILSGQSRMLDQ